MESTRGSRRKTDNEEKKLVFNGDTNTRVTCTACFQQIILQKPGTAWRHPLLRVLLCKKCYEFYTSGEIAMGDDGVDEQCRWCGQGGKLIGCDFCHNAFCKSCIKSNLGRNEFAATSGESWRCYVCDSTPLKPLVSYCSSVLEFVESLEDKGSVKVECIKQKHSSHDKAESSDSSASALDVGPNVFCGSHITELVKLLKSATEPLHQLIAETEEELTTDLQSADSSRCQKKYETLASNLKTQYVKSVHALSAVKRTKPQTAVNNCTDDTNLPVVSIERVDQSLTEQTSHISNDSVTHANSQPTKADSKNNSSRASRADIEAQRDLHKQMLSSKDESSESGTSSESSTSSEDAEATSSEDSDDDDEYDPKSEIRQVKIERGHERRTTAKKLKMRAAVRQLKEIRERMKKKRMKKRRSSKRKSDADDDDDDRSAKKSSKKSKKKQNKSDNAEDAEKPNNTGKGSHKESKEGSRSSEEQENNSTKKKHKHTTKESDNSGTDNDDDVEPDDGSMDKAKENVEDGGTENSNMQIDENCEDQNDAENSAKSEESKTKKKAVKGTKSTCSAADDDDDLDRELKNLGKLPKLKIKVNSGKTCEEVDKNSDSSATGTATSKAESTKKAGSRRRLVDELNSDDDEGDCDEDHQRAATMPAMDAEESIDAIPLETVESNANARREMLDEIEDDDQQDDDDDDDDDEDNDVDDDSAKVKGNKRKKQVKNADKDSAEDKDIAPEQKKKKLTSKLLRAKLSDSDDDDDDSDHAAANKKKKKSRKSQHRKETGSDDDDDSDVVITKTKRKRRAEKKSDDDDSSSDGSFVKRKKKGNQRKRRRIKANSDSSDENENEAESSNEEGESEENESDPDESTPGRKRRKIRRILKDKKLSKQTVDAAKAEEERRKRTEERQKLFNQVTIEDTSSPLKCPITTQLVLETDEETKEPIIEVHKKLIRKLKPHQVDAVKFIWNCCVESLQQLKKEEGSGCILAHCMGLGKTLSVITFIHTLLNNAKQTGMKTCLVLCPLNTVLNWQAEFDLWLKDSEPFDVYELSCVKDNWGRSELMSDWQNGGGAMIMGYEMFRNLSQSTRIKNKKQKKIFTESLLDPGPDLIVCDEGHVLKNDATGLSKATNQVKTRRRIVLTGTPLQNNLIEYHCMVNFVKPNLLGTRKEFCNRFVNPIMNGQCSDSSPFDVKLMKRRAHIVHETLAGCVQRKDYTALTKFLPPKHEYVISIRLSKVQIELYNKYLGRLSSNVEDLAGMPLKGARIFTDYQNLMKIWTHPWVLKMDEIRQETKKLNIRDSDDDSFIDDSEYETDASSHSGKEKEKNGDDKDEVEILGSASEDEWRPRRRTRQAAAVKKDEDANGKEEKKEKDKVGDKAGAAGDDSGSDKEIVKEWRTRSRGLDKDNDATANSTVEPDEPEKVSAQWWAEYVTSDDQFKTELSGKLLMLADILNMSESIGDKVLVFSQSLLSLDLIEAFLTYWDKSTEDQIAGTQGWDKGIDYVRMDGSTSAQNRKEWAEMFNDPENAKVRLFLISTKAGSLGINLVAANRVIVFDASWNPTHDVQSIFRVYRFGQTKPVYVYRFLAQGTMEEKIYERQVTKQSLSQRVIDEHQIERHFTANDLRDLYIFKPDRLDDPNRTERPTPKLPKDRMLAELLTKLKDWIIQYHEHDSLLENKLEEELPEEERKAAWEEYEQEKKGLRVPPPMPGVNQGVGVPYTAAPVSAVSYSTMFANVDPHYIAQTIFRANPGITKEELTQRVNEVLNRAHMARLLQQEQEYRLHLERQRLMQYQEERLRREAAVLATRQQVSANSASSLLQMLSPTNSGDDASSTSQLPAPGPAVPK